MDLNDYLETVKNGGWLDHILPPDPEDADDEVLEDMMMRTELSLCFPLLTDEQKMVLLGAWWATRALALGVNLPRTGMDEADAGTIDQNTNQAESLYMQAKEAVHALADMLHFTEAQRNFVEDEILHVPFRDDE